MARINLSNKMRKLLIGLGAAFFMLVGLAAPAAPAMTDSTDYTAWSDQGIIYTAPAGSAYYPSVIYDNNHFGSGSSSPTYKMWYSDGEGGTFLVTSSDGWTWSAPTDLTGLVSAHHVQVLYDANHFGSGASGPLYRIWYWKTDSNLYDISSIYTAQSVDGINWTDTSPLLQGTSAQLVTGTSTDWNYGSYGPVQLFYQPDASNMGVDPWNYKYVMYYDGATGSSEVTGLAYSSEGLFWKAYSGNPVLAASSTLTGWDSNDAVYGTVYHDAQGFHYWYSGSRDEDLNGDAPPYDGIGYASSADGETWFKNPTPIFHVSDGVPYRDERVYTPSVINDGTGFLKMYYSAQSTDGGPKKIGLATLTGTQSWLLDSKAPLGGGSSQWNLDLITTPPGGSASHTNPFVMTQDSIIWIASQPAVADVTFDSGTWTVTLATPTDWASTCSAEVGDYNLDGTFIPFNTTSDISYDDDTGIMTITIPADAGTVNQNDYLALKVYNSSGDSQTITLGGSSYLVSPSSTPDYPLPEMSAGILLALGLAGLGGFMVIRHKKAEKASRA